MYDYMRDSSSPNFHRLISSHLPLPTWTKFPYHSAFRGHFQCVNTLSFSHGEGQHLLSGGDDKRLLIWDAYEEPSKAKPLKEFHGHLNNIFTAIFDSTNTHIFSCGLDGLIIHYDVEKGGGNNPVEGRRMMYSDDTVFRVSLNPTNDNIILSCNEGGLIQLWDMREDNPNTWSFLRRKEQTSICFHPFLEQYFLASADGKLELFDLRKVVSPNGASSSHAVSVRQYTTQLQKRRKVGESSITSICFNPEADLILIPMGSYLPTIYSFSAPDPLVSFYADDYVNRSTMKSYSFGASAVEGSDELVISASGDNGNVYVWSVPSEVRHLSPKQVEDMLTEKSHNISCSSRTGPYKDIHFLSSKNTLMPAFINDQPTEVIKGSLGNVNNSCFHPALPILCCSGIQKMIQCHSFFPFEKNETFAPAADTASHSRLPRWIRMLPFLPTVDDDTIEEDERIRLMFESINDDARDIFETDMDDSSNDQSTEDSEEDDVDTNVVRILGLDETNRLLPNEDNESIIAHDSENREDADSS